MAEARRGLTRRGFLIGAFAGAVTVPAYLLGGTLAPRHLVRRVEAVPPTVPDPPWQEILEPTPTLEPVAEVVTVPGAPGRRSKKRLPPVRLVIPKIGVDSLIESLGINYDNRGALVWETAEFVVGHYSNTANPGEEGNCVLSGHISSIDAGHVFRRLPELVPGDSFVVVTEESPYLYRVVDRQIVLPSATSIMDPGDGSKLTLLTCVPDGTYTHRLIVSAVPV